ncbi:UNVERIFIED_CONTAM: hypothetical protein Sradi_2638100 [Sesamum radiatum]|uniref:Reverse transcriptase Ty1/copia-type domain-containing protein n=1 Tax=Sesamum radiatum TaxID=300843 RepID=A0AAW2S5B6_SESRA
MKFEMDLMGSNRALTLVDPPKGVKLVRCKWVYKHKLRANKEWRKVTLSNLGSTLRKPTRLWVMAKSIRILFVVAAWYDYEIGQMDMETSFFNGFVEEEIYIDQLEGFISVGEE